MSVPGTETTITSEAYYQHLLLDIRQHLAVQLGRVLNEISAQDRLIEDLGVDSLELADVLVMLETQHAISVPVDAVARLDTVAALADAAVTCAAQHG